MSETVVPFVRKRRPDEYPTFTKIVDGEVFECVNVDALSPAQRAKYFADTKKGDDDGR